MPGFPAKDDAPIRESDYDGRDIKEIDFEHNALRIGQFRAVDFFGDGYVSVSPFLDHLVLFLSLEIMST